MSIECHPRTADPTLLNAQPRPAGRRTLTQGDRAARPRGKIANPRADAIRSAAPSCVCARPLPAPISCCTAITRSTALAGGRGESGLLPYIRSVRCVHCARRYIGACSSRPRGTSARLCACHSASAAAGCTSVPNPKNMTPDDMKRRVASHRADTRVPTRCQSPGPGYPMQAPSH